MERAVEKRSTVGLKDQTGWSLAHMANIKARFGDGDGAMDCLHALAQTCVGKNFFTYHNDYRGTGVTNDWFFGRSTPFQIDANMGLTAAVLEMLVQSTPNLIKLIPALPQVLAKGRVSGIRTRAGVSVDLAWQQCPFELEATLISQRDQTLTLIAPEQANGDQRIEVSLKAGVPLCCKWSLTINQVVLSA
jgi:alpha-L-fucosidase 2